MGDSIRFQVIRWAIVGVILSFPSARVAAQAFGDYTLSKRIDPMSDLDSSILTTTSSGASLSWRCDGDRLELFFVIQEFLESSDPVQVRWRFDDLPASAQARWPVTARGTGAFAPEDLVPLFTTLSIQSSTVLVRARDYRGQVHDIRFSLRGVSAGLQALGCGQIDFFGDVAVTHTESGRLQAIAYSGAAPQGSVTIQFYCYDGEPRVGVSLNGEARYYETKAIALNAEPVSLDFFLDYGLGLSLEEEYADQFISMLGGKSLFVLTYAAFAQEIQTAEISLAGLPAALARLSCFGNEARPDMS